MTNHAYEAVIGLEVHAELRTESKIFCSCPTAFGAPPNTQCCPICTGLPGAMPSLNRRVVELAVRAGVALGCEISEYSRLDRKQYFYPDLPKAYQISQHDRPLCRNGMLTISTSNGTRRIGISRIHIEEDAGKLIHSGEHTLVDCNRCGVPLIEIVSAPEIRTAEEASAYLRALRGILLTCGISDCKMQEGALRCDINLSLRKIGSNEMGVRSEIKNLNSFAFVEKAIQYEIARQAEALSRGETLRMETRRYDPTSGKTVLMRIKERSVDYRFLPEYDLPMLRVTEETVAEIRKLLPELPDARANRLQREFSLTAGDAAVLVDDPALADYFEQAAGRTVYPKLLANLILTDLLHFCEKAPLATSVPASRMAELSDLLGEGRINSSTAKKLLSRLIREDFNPAQTVASENLEQIRDPDQIRALVLEVLENNPKAVADYRRGRSAALRALQGNAMSRTAGRVDPVLLERRLLEMLNAEPV